MSVLYLLFYIVIDWALPNNDALVYISVAARVKLESAPLKEEIVF